MAVGNQIKASKYNLVTNIAVDVADDLLELNVSYADSAEMRDKATRQH